MNNRLDGKKVAILVENGFEQVEMTEPRKALQEATAIATEKGYKQLLPDIQLTQAEVFLAERRLPEARSTAEKAIAGAGTQYKEVAAEAKSVFGHAQVLSGSRQGRVLCENSLQMAQELEDAALISRMMMKLAEALLEMGDAQNALPLAAQAQERFSRAGQVESEWRAFLITAQANERTGNNAGAQMQRTRAKESLAQLEQGWGSAAYKQYLSRPDIQSYYRQLGR